MAQLMVLSRMRKSPRVAGNWKTPNSNRPREMTSTAPAKPPSSPANFHPLNRSFFIMTESRADQSGIRPMSQPVWTAVVSVKPNAWSI